MLIVQRSSPPCGSLPIIANITPTAAMPTPLAGDLPDSTATIEMPKIEKAKSSGAPIDSMIGRSMGMVSARTTAPNTPPTMAAV